MAFKKVVPGINIHPEYKSFTNDFIEALISLFGPELHSVYMCGSVPKGTAIPGKSDADFTLVLREVPADDQLESLKKLERRFLKKYPFIIKIDTPVSTVSEILENPYDWGFWIKILCICLYGEDIGDIIPDFEPCDQLVHGINGETEKVLRELIETYREKSNPELERKLVKRLLRALYSLTLNVESCWVDDFSTQADIILKHYPQWKESVTYLVQGLEPSGFIVKKKLLGIADQVYKTILSDVFLKIDNLVHRSDLIPQVADWIFYEFIDGRIPNVSREKIVSVLENRNESEPPVTFVAIAGSKIVGTVSLFPHDLKERMEWSPWLGALYVDEKWRGFGIGKRLIDFIRNKAVELGYEELYLRTEKTAPYYESLGWKKIDFLIDEHGQDVTVFLDELDNVLDRRASIP